jgi:hypothetical protein
MRGFCFCRRPMQASGSDKALSSHVSAEFPASRNTDARHIEALIAQDQVAQGSRSNTNSIAFSPAESLACRRSPFLLYAIFFGKSWAGFSNANP